jgi:hypothetical protein
MTGYDPDTFASDDTGEVNTFIGEPGSYDLQSDCTPQADQPTANSGCGSYVAHLVVEPGATPTSAVLSPQTKLFLNALLIGKHLMTTVLPITDTELFSGRSRQEPPR